MFDIWFMEEVQRQKGSEDPNIRLQAYLASLIVYNTKEEWFEFQGDYFIVKKKLLGGGYYASGEKIKRMCFVFLINDRVYDKLIIETDKSDCEILEDVLEWARSFNLFRGRDFLHSTLFK